MKRLFVFVPAILLVLFLLNSFVLKQKETEEKTNQSLTGLTLPDKSLIEVSAKDSTFNPNRNKSGLVNNVLKSTDGGQTWQDISEGLPEIEQPVIFFCRRVRSLFTCKKCNVSQ